MSTGPESDGRVFATDWFARDVVFPILCCVLAVTQMTGLVYIVDSVVETYSVAVVASQNYHNSQCHFVLSAGSFVDC